MKDTNAAANTTVFLYDPIPRLFRSQRSYEERKVFTCSYL